MANISNKDYNKLSKKKSPPSTKIKDFIAVRGKLEENSFVKDIEQERERTKETAAKWIQKLTT